VEDQACEGAPPCVALEVSDGREGLPADVGGAAAVEDHGVVGANARDAAVSREYVPELGIVGVVHGVPGLIGGFGEHADETLEELVASVG
jgi:hypothetical protein